MTEAEYEQVEAAKAAIDEATPGPWRCCGCGQCQLVWGNSLLIHDQPDGGDEAPTPCNSTGINNAILIAAAPALVRRVQELEAERYDVEAMKREIEARGRDISRLEDWQAKAVEILKRLENKMLATDPEKWLDYEKQLSTLTALIEQAEGVKE